VRAALLKVPANCATPIAAELSLAATAGTPVSASFDFLQTGSPTCEISVETDAGNLLLTQGGGALAIDQENVALAPRAEYPALYEYFADLIAAGRSDADPTPLALVADAFLHPRHEIA
jgi:hypothetical protein